VNDPNAVFKVESGRGGTYSGKILDGMLAKITQRVFKELWCLPSYRNFYLPGLESEDGIKDGEGGYTVLGSRFLGMGVKKRGIVIGVGDDVEEIRDGVVEKFMREARGVPEDGDAFVAVRIKGDMQVYKKKVGDEFVWRSVGKIGSTVGNVYKILGNCEHFGMCV
jgi:hypothetical protein